MQQIKLGSTQYCKVADSATYELHSITVDSFQYVLGGFSSVPEGVVWEQFGGGLGVPGGFWGMFWGCLGGVWGCFGRNLGGKTGNLLLRTGYLLLRIFSFQYIPSE